MTEKRKYMRFDTMLQTAYKILGRQTNKIRSTIRDISKEGLRLASSEHVKKGTVLELEMNVPGDNIPIFACGEVAWSKKSEHSKCDVGLKFVNIKNLDKIRLLEFVYDQWVNKRKDRRSK